MLTTYSYKMIVFKGKDKKQSNKNQNNKSPLRFILYYLIHNQIVKTNKKLDENDE